MVSDSTTSGSSDESVNYISVLGSTGTIGLSVLELVRLNPQRFKVLSLSVKSNIKLLKSQILEFSPKLVAVYDSAAAVKLKEELEFDDIKGVEIVSGDKSSEQAATLKGVQTVVIGIVGYKALGPLLASIKANLGIALANKESIVAAGSLVREELAKSSARLIPVDSEHNSIFQLLERVDIKEISNITLTASGGPFLHHAREELENITPEEAVKHPKWNMGAKISVDSATLINKGLELIEAHYLFGIDEKNIKIVIHPNSIIHGLVEYVDSSQQAVLYSPDMKIPILHALSRLSGFGEIKSDISSSKTDTLKSATGSFSVGSFGLRASVSGVPKLDLPEISRLDFLEASEDKYKSLYLARDALKKGSIFPCIYNAASEFATELFLNNKLSFLGITDVVEKGLNLELDIFSKKQINSLEDAEEVDLAVREELNKLLPAIN